MSLLAFRYKRFHISFLFGWLAAGLLIGLVLGKVWPGMNHWLWLIAGLILLPMIIRHRRWWMAGVAVLAGVLIGWQRGSDMTIQLSGYDQYLGTTVTVNGVIRDDPQRDARGMQQFSVANVKINGTSRPASIFTSTTSKLKIKRGDVVQLYGKIKPGFGSYPATMRYATLAHANSGATPLRDLRDHFSSGVRRTVMEPEASLGLGFVVGQRSALPPELDEQLKVVGLTHIVVASGYNLTILVRFARRILARYSRYLALAVSSGLVVGFIGFSGLTPSMTRAGAVTLLSLLAWYYGRRFHPLLLITYVAAGTAYVDPMFIWSDIGWYLSFLAFMGVLVVAPLVTARILRDKKPGAVAQLCIETIAAQVMTLPLILLMFERVPLTSFISNLLVAPLIPFAMLATTIAGIAGMISSTLLDWLGLPATISIGYIVAVVEYLSDLSWAQVDMKIPVFAMAGLYIALMLTMAMWWRQTHYDFRSSSIVE